MGCVYVCVCVCVCVLHERGSSLVCERCVGCVRSVGWAVHIKRWYVARRNCIPYSVCLCACVCVRVRVILGKQLHAIYYWSVGE